ncbi:MAG: hypothetical protein FGM43_09370 [Sinobacteraceae bacterium]|nr:hypothetical protein [Nevskiaceae bacterium]
MTRMSLTRRDFVSATTLAVIAGGTAARALDIGATATGRSPQSWRIGLVQSAPWDVDASRLYEDTARNLERMLETIARAGPDCDWLAFNDCPLTGRSTSLMPSAAQIERLRTAARQHACAVSFGCGVDRKAVLLSADDTEVQYGPLVRLNGRRIAIVSTAQSDADIKQAVRGGAEALLVMGSGPNVASKRIADIASGLPRLQVNAACDSHVPGHTADWLGGTLACDAHGVTLGEIAHANEAVLQVQLLFGVRGTEA